MGLDFFSVSLSLSTTLDWLRCLLLVHVVAWVLTLVAAVVVPATLPSIVVVTKDKRVKSGSLAISVRYVGDSVEFFANSALNDNILFVLVILSCRFEVQLVVVRVRHDNLCLLHVHTDRQDSVKRKVGVLDVISVHFLVLI